MGIKQLREEEKGSGLVLTLMVLLVLSVLGVAIGTLTIGSYRLSDATRDDTSAYYVAEAGAVAAYEQIQSKVLDAYKNNQTEGSFYEAVSGIMNFKDGQPNVKFDNQFGSQPSVKMHAEKDSLQKYIIHSTGEVDGKERTVTKPVTVKWVDKNTGGGLPKIPENAALLTQGSIEISNGHLIGDIHTNTRIKKSIKISGNPVFTNTKLYYPAGTIAESLISRSWNADWLENQIESGNEIDFGAYKTLLNNVKVPKKKQYNNNIFTDYSDSAIYDLKVKDTISFNKMSVSPGKTLNIDPMGGNHTILVNNLSVMSGSLNITGKGTITLIVTDTISFNNPANITISGTSSQLLLIYTGSLRNFNGINKMDANVVVIGNDNPIIMNNTTINGLLLTDSTDVTYSGNNMNRPSDMMLIAPHASVKLTESSYINGTVIANTFKMSGGSKLTYATIDTTGFPFGSTGTTSDPKPEDIISSGTITED